MVALMLPARRFEEDEPTQVMPTTQRVPAKSTKVDARELGQRRSGVEWWDGSTWHRQVDE